MFQKKIYFKSYFMTFVFLGFGCPEEIFFIYPSFKGLDWCRWCDCLPSVAKFVSRISILKNKLLELLSGKIPIILARSFSVLCCLFAFSFCFRSSSLIQSFAFICLREEIVRRFFFFFWVELMLLKWPACAPSWSHLVLFESLLMGPTSGFVFRAVLTLS